MSVRYRRELGRTLGMAAIFDPDAEVAEITRTLERMRHAVEGPDCARDGEVTASRGVGCVRWLSASETQRSSAAREARSATWAVFDGELYNREELKEEILDDAGDDADLALALFARDGTSFAEQLNGQFNLAICRETEPSLLIVTDRYGYRPLFTSRAGSRLLFATEVKAILAVLDTLPRLDGIGIFQLMRHGWVVGNRTWLDSIHVVDPGSVITLRPGRAECRRYYRPRFRAGRDFPKIDDFAAASAAKLSQSVLRMSGDSPRVGIPLSGGLDSRSILLAAAGREPQAVTYTFGDEGSRDVEYAAQLAAAARVPHRHLTYPVGRLGELLAPVVWRTEGLVPFATASFSSLYFHARLSEEADMLLYGHCGDALTGAHLRPDVVLRRSRQGLIEQIFRRLAQVSDVMLRRVFTPPFFARHASWAREDFRVSFAEIEAESLSDLADAWDMENRQRRGVFHSGAVDRQRFAVRAPFLDNALVDHLLQAPPLWRYQQIAYKQMIRNSFPWAAHVPWTWTGKRVRTSVCADLADAALAYTFKRTRSICSHLSGATPRPAPTSFRDLGAELRSDRRIATAIRDFAASSSFPGDVFDRAGIEEIVIRHWDRNEDHAQLVTQLATLATAFRLFASGSPRVPAEEPPSV
jgi:asparagine synthetase B (glutamine-hydrolysing)